MINFYTERKLFLFLVPATYVFKMLVIYFAILLQLDSLIEYLKYVKTLVIESNGIKTKGKVTLAEKK